MRRSGSTRRPCRVVAVQSFIFCFTVIGLVSTSIAQNSGDWLLRMPSTKPPVSYATMVYDSARNVTVLFVQGQTWEWDGTNWTQRMPTNSPSNRAFHAMAFDSARAVTVLFGGIGMGSLSDTWEWDGNNWSQKMPAAKPTARQDHAMAFDSARGVAVLFGGVVSGTNNAETWEWSGTNWTQRMPATSPSARSVQSMVFDSARGRTLLFGGSVNTANGETWEWDGTNWSQLMPSTSPPARFGAGLAYDSTRNLTVLFGGLGGGFLGDTWEWNGSDWAQKFPSVSPAARFRFGMTYDTSRGVVVLFGGQGSLFFDETWERNCPSDVVIVKQPASQSVGPAGLVMFSVTVTGTGPFQYQWRRNGAPLSDGNTIAGSTTPDLTMSQLSDADNGLYDCKITTVCASLLSDQAVLFVDPCKSVAGVGDCNANGVLDSCEITANAALDGNADGMLDSCPSAACGACGAGMATMMPLIFVGFLVTRRHSHCEHLPGPR